MFKHKRTDDEPLSIKKLIEIFNSNDAYNYIIENFSTIIEVLIKNDRNIEIKDKLNNFYLEQNVEEYLASLDNVYDEQAMQILDYYLPRDLRSFITSQCDIDSELLENNNYFDYVCKNYKNLNYVVKVFDNDDFKNVELLIFKLKIMYQLHAKSACKDAVKAIFGEEMYSLYTKSNFDEVYELLITESEFEEEDFPKSTYESLISSGHLLIFKFLVYINPTKVKYDVIIEANSEVLSELIDQEIGLYALHFIYSEKINKKELKDNEIEEATLKILDNLEEDFDTSIYKRYVNYFGTNEFDLIISHNVKQFMEFFRQSNFEIEFENEVNTFHFLEKDCLYTCLDILINTWTKDEILNNKQRIIKLFNEYTYDNIINIKAEFYENLKGKLNKVVSI